MQLIHKEVVIPDDANVYFVGDIHGSYDLLIDALRLVGFQQHRDYCICVGDLIDRGPDNFKVLAKFLYGSDKFLSVMGNHDGFMGYFNVGDTFPTWMWNGGRWVIDDDLDNDQLEALGKDVRDRLPIFMTIKHRGNTYGVVHGGVPNVYDGAVPKLRNWGQLITDVQDYINSGNRDLRSVNRAISPYLWDRDVLSGFQDGVDYPPVDGVDFTFHGHTYVADPVVYKNRVYIDTGGVFNGRLTMAWIDRDNKLQTMTTNDKYDDPTWLTLGALNG